MSWKRGLRRASWRGVEFRVRDRDLEGGRRIHNHEYPKRDTNFPEDMGKSSREFSVDAYIIGDDYMARRDRLIAACERQGPGTYIDQWGVSQRVVCPRFRLMEQNDEGRMCRFSLDFIEAGGGVAAAAPVGVVATAVQLAAASAALATAAVAHLARSFAR